MVLYAFGSECASIQNVYSIIGQDGNKDAPIDSVDSNIMDCKPKAWMSGRVKIKREDNEEVNVRKRKETTPLVWPPGHPKKIKIEIVIEDNREQATSEGK